VKSDTLVLGLGAMFMLGLLFAATFAAGYGRAERDCLAAKACHVVVAEDGTTSVEWGAP
jgi:hypothetical protein